MVMHVSQADTKDLALFAHECLESMPTFQSTTLLAF